MRWVEKLNVIVLVGGLGTGLCFRGGTLDGRGLVGVDVAESTGSVVVHFWGEVIPLCFE